MIIFCDINKQGVKMPQKGKKSFKTFIQEIKKISISIKKEKKQSKKNISPHTYHHNNDDGLSGKFYLEH